jgi:hypothetical protein
VVDQVFSRNIPFANTFPLHERIVYGLMLPAAILLLAGASWRTSNGIKLIWGTSAAAMALLLAPGPFNLFSDIFWPSGRSTSPIAFFHVLGIGLILVFVLQRANAAGYRWSGRVQHAVAIFIGLSVASQLSLFFERVKQSRQDWAVGQSVLTEMRKKAALRPDQPIAVFATTHNSAQLRRVFFMDYGASAFTAEWSRVPMLRLLSGNHFTEASVPDSVCRGFQPPFEVRQHNEVLVVCME